MNLDELASTIKATLGPSTVAEFAFRLVELGQLPRLQISRALPTEVRYVRITAIDDQGAAWEFEVLGGRYSHQDPSLNFDARRGGSATEVIQQVRRWLVDLGTWDARTDADR
ncbi:MAG: hypothetical protein U0271_33485 [Polyangiaceae bacterium]